MSAAPLTPGSPRDMLDEAIGRLRAIPQDARQRADLFETLAQQIAATHGNWEARRTAGADGCVIFYGEFGHAVVIHPGGKIYRGNLALPEEFRFLPPDGNVQPVYAKLKDLG